MENIFDVLKAYNDLNTSIKKDNFINDGFFKKKWNEISFNAVIEDLNSTCVCAYPLSEKGEKLEKLIFIRYHKNALFKKFPIAKKNEVIEIRELNQNGIVKGVAMLESLTPVISLKLIRLEK